MTLVNSFWKYLISSRPVLYSLRKKNENISINTTVVTLGIKCESKEVRLKNSRLAL
jgi:hypothetical protein